VADPPGGVAEEFWFAVLYERARPAELLVRLPFAS
jgi:hypothetical protein